MLLCYTQIEREGVVGVELCLVPDKPDPLSMPVPIKSLKPTRAAVFRVGTEEALTVAIDEKDKQLIISALEPASIYMTPNLAQSPGFNSKHIKVVSFEDGSIKTYYSRDRNSWDEWIANRVRV